MLGAYERQIASGIAKALVLFEGGIMLFIYDDQSGAGERRKNCRTCPR